MSEFQTAADFAKHMDTNFRVELESPKPIEIKIDYGYATGNRAKRAGRHGTILGGILWSSGRLSTAGVFIAWLILKWESLRCFWYRLSRKQKGLDMKPCTTSFEEIN